VAKKVDSRAEERSRMRAQLMARVQDGDRDSCRALLDDIGPMLVGFLRRRIADRNELEDVYQETLMALFPGAPHLPTVAATRALAVAIARNVAADHARRYWTRSNFEQLTDALPEVSAAEEPRSDPNLADAMART
jgi:DNA-directed RNA polymerase specialized sigma24 family protein